jgi:hypothetical protein
MKHADILWQLQSQEEVEFYLSGLFNKDWADAQIALHMIAAEAIDGINQIEPEVEEIINNMK